MRKLGWLGVLAAMMPLSIYISAPVSGQQQQAQGSQQASSQQTLPRPYGTPPPMVVTAFGGKPYTYQVPRTPWGDPDLQGVWSSDDMEGVGIGVQQGGGRGGAGRGDGRGGGGPCAAEASAAALAGPPALYLTDEQLEARRKLVACQSGDRDRTSTSTFRNDYARRAFPQTRLLVDPPSGLMPTVLPGARIMPRGTNGTGPINSWLDFPLYERCITRGIGGSVLRVIYGNGNRIVQGPGVVAFSYEMLPDTRIFPIDNSPHVSEKISMYLGNSRARWEGEDLVVETRNLTDQTAFGINGLGTQHSKAMRITERFRRVADDIIQYQATWDDPLTYSTPFTVSFPLTPLSLNVLLPYDCHEGNKAVEMTLAAERDEDKSMAEAAAKGIKRERRAINQNAGGGAGRGGRGQADTGAEAEK